MLGASKAGTASLPKVTDSTKKKLAMFGADTSPTKDEAGPGEGQQYKHREYTFIKPDKIKVTATSIIFEI